MAELSFLDYFSKIEDPRIDRNKLYPVDEILLTSLCAVICGAEGWQDVEVFGKSKLLFLRQYLPFDNGIPSDDTFRRFFRAISQNTFQDCFISWVNSLDISINNSVIAIDGKTSRRSHDGAQKALHTVSAFASEARIVLGQQKTDENEVISNEARFDLGALKFRQKSNEITAIPQLLELLDIKGSIVTIDAMGTQKDIAQKITDKEADYILALKGNQSSLNDDVRMFFEDDDLVQHLDKYEETDGGHGRIEVRKCTATDDIDWLNERHDWTGLKSIIRIESEVERSGKNTSETRYYISSLPADNKKLQHCIRSHWAIENSLHWVLDMSFNDDQSRIRKENAPENEVISNKARFDLEVLKFRQNMAIIKHTALNMIRGIQKKRQSIKGLRKQAGWNNDVLDSILQQKFI